MQNIRQVEHAARMQPFATTPASHTKNSVHIHSPHDSIDATHAAQSDMPAVYLIFFFLN